VATKAGQGRPKVGTMGKAKAVISQWQGKRDKVSCREEVLIRDCLELLAQMFQSEKTSPQR